MGLNFDNNEYQTEFNKANKNNTGFMDYAEFRCMILGKKAKKLTPNILRLIFDETDTDKNGTLDFDEFIHLCKRMGFGLLTNETSKDMRQYFNTVDIDKNGRIDFKEFVYAILGKDLTQSQTKKCIRYSQMISKIKSVFKEMDVNNSGSLILREFVIAAKKLNCNESNAELNDIFKSNVSPKSKSISLKQFLAVMYQMSNFDHEDVAHKNNESDEFFGWMKYGLQGINMTEEKLQSVFRQIDADNSKVLDLEEFKQCGKLLGIEVFDDDEYQNEFDKADRDGSGFLDYGEFRCAILGKDSKKLTTNILRMVFDEVDKDKNGSLDFSEFRFLCKRMGFGAFTSESKQDMEVYFSKVDVDGNGVIDFREFVQAILGERLSDKAIKKAVKYSRMVGIIKRVFRMVDESGYGQLNLKEFVIAARKLKCRESDGKLKVIFESIAKNGKTISLHEFVSVMYRLIAMKCSLHIPMC